MFGFTRKAKIAAAHAEAIKIENSRRVRAICATMTYSDALRRDHAVFGGEPMTREEASEMRAMGL